MKNLGLLTLLIIRYAEHTLDSAGRTQASMTMNLINGVGDSVVILFDAHIADSGSHRVFNARHEQIEYTAVQNLYHELAHAMHMMNGTWRYIASETQAIEEENIFRPQLAEFRGQIPSQIFQEAGVFIADDLSEPIVSR